MATPPSAFDAKEEHQAIGDVLSGTVDTGGAPIGGGYWMRAPVPAPFAEVAGDATGEPPNQTSVSAADDATRALESMTLHPGPSPEGGYFENGDNTQGGEEHPSNGVPSFGNPYANDCDHGGVAYDAYGYQLPGYQVGAGGGYDGHELQNSGGYDGYDSQGAYSQGQGAYPAQGSTYPNTVHQSLYRGHPGNQLAMQQHPSFLYAQQQRQIAPDPAALYAYYRQAAELGDPTAQTALQRAFASMPVHGFGTVVGSSPETTHGAVSPGSSNGDAVAAAHAEALYRQMAHLQSSQMAHAQMWGGGGQWNDEAHHTGWGMAGGQHLPVDHQGHHQGHRGVHFADPAATTRGGWKPPSPRGTRGRRENGRAGRRNGFNGEFGGYHAVVGEHGHGNGHGGHGGDRRRNGGHSHHNDVPSPALEQFRLHKNHRLELRDIAGHVQEFARDQHGSRFIQQKLETATSDDLATVLDEITPNLCSLAVDVFGNYVAQKFFEKSTETQRELLAARLTGNVVRLSLHAFGCRVVQTAIATCTTRTAVLLVNELRDDVLRCVRDQNGNHVVQKTIEHVPVGDLGFVLSALVGNVNALSQHPYGCRVIQRALERGDPWPGDGDPGELDGTGDGDGEGTGGDGGDGGGSTAIGSTGIAGDGGVSGTACGDGEAPTAPNKTVRVRFNTREIVENAASLARDQYGNYVVQHVLSHGDVVSRARVLAVLSKQIVPLAQHKFASNVVEKCLTYCGVEERDVMIGEILGTSGGLGTSGTSAESDVSENSGRLRSTEDLLPSVASTAIPATHHCPLPEMMKDQFANYVVQKLLEVCDEVQRARLLEKVRLHLRDVKKLTYGKHVVARVEKLAEISGLSGAGPLGGNSPSGPETAVPEGARGELGNREEGT